MILFFALLFLTTVILIIPLRPFEFLKKTLPTIVIAFAVALGAYSITQEISKDLHPSEVMIAVRAEDSVDFLGVSVVFRGASIDGKWYHATDLCKGSGWISPDGMVLTWLSYDQPKGMAPSVQFKLPGGNERFLVFNTDKQQGQVDLTIDGEEQVVDLYSDRESTIDRAITIARSEAIKANNQIAYIVAGFSFICISVLCFFLYKLHAKKEKITTVQALIPSNRELWADVLRVIAAFTIVWLHCTNNVYENWYNPDSQHWFSALYVNSFTTFAVPSFFMLSGAFLLKKRASINEVLKKRIPVQAIPLLFWSVVYIFVVKFYWGNDVNVLKAVLKIPFESQYWHLWFMYPMIGLYLLLPIIKKLYESLDHWMRVYAFLLLLVLPSLLSTMISIFGATISTPWFAIGFPEMPLFVLGTWLTQNRSGWRGKWKLWMVLAFVGYSGTVALSYYCSLQSNIASKVMFSYGNLPVLVFSSSIFMLFYALEDSFQKLSIRIVKIIRTLSGLSMGIYFTHMLALVFINNQQIAGVLFSNNTGSLTNMFFGALLYFVCIAMFCFCGVQIPYIGLLFGKKAESNS